MCYRSGLFRVLVAYFCCRSLGPCGSGYPPLWLGKGQDPAWDPETQEADPFLPSKARIRVARVPLFCSNSSSFVVEPPTELLIEVTWSSTSDIHWVSTGSCASCERISLSFSSPEPLERASIPSRSGAEPSTEPKFEEPGGSGVGARTKICMSRHQPFDDESRTLTQNKRNRHLEQEIKKTATHVGCTARMFTWIGNSSWPKMVTKWRLINDDHLWNVRSLQTTETLHDAHASSFSPLRLFETAEPWPCLPSNIPRKGLWCTLPPKIIAKWLVDKWKSVMHYKNRCRKRAILYVMRRLFLPTGNRESPLSAYVTSPLFCNFQNN